MIERNQVYFKTKSNRKKVNSVGEPWFWQRNFCIPREDSIKLYCKWNFAPIIELVCLISLILLFVWTEKHLGFVIRMYIVKNIDSYNMNKKVFWFLCIQWNYKPPGKISESLQWNYKPPERYLNPSGGIINPRKDIWIPPVEL